LEFKNIIFDWDGTLARTLDLWLKGYQIAFKERGLQFEPKEIVANFFQNHQDIPAKFPEMDFPVIFQETLDYVDQSLSSVALYDGAEATLNELKTSGVKLSLVSSSTRQLLEKGVGAHRLEKYFISTIAGNDGFGYKPSAAPFEEMLERIGANASDTLVIGDSHVDITAGKAVGCYTCLFAPPQNAQFHDVKQLREMNADIEISQLAELLQYT